MDQATYDQAAERIKAGRLVEINGRSASSLEELDWIQAVENNQPLPARAPAVVRHLPPDEVQAAQRALDEANLRRAAEAQQAAAAQGMAQVFPPPHPLALFENPTTSVEGLAQAPPVNPGQPEAARETGAGPVVESAPPTSSGQEPAASSGEPTGDAAAANPNPENPVVVQNVIRDIPSPPRVRGR